MQSGPEKNAQSLMHRHFAAVCSRIKPTEYTSRSNNRIENTLSHKKVKAKNGHTARNGIERIKRNAKNRTQGRVYREKID